MVVSNKKKFLVSHNYGMGDVVCYIYATSFDEIKQKYPEFELRKDSEPWFTKEIEDYTKKYHIYDIDDPPRGILEGILEDRVREDARRSKSPKSKGSGESRGSE